MKTSQGWLAAALIVTALIAGALGWWLRGRHGQPETAAKNQPPDTEKEGSRKDSPPQQQSQKKEQKQDDVLPVIAIQAAAPAMAPEEIERLVVSPLENNINGAAGVRRVRSVCRQGGCSVWVDLEPSTDIYEARQRIVERIGRAELPPTVIPTLAPIRYRENEVLLIGLQSTAAPQTAQERTRREMDLLALANEAVRNRLQRIPGVSQVLVSGGMRPQVQVKLGQDRLLKYGISLSQVEKALQDNIASGATGTLRIDNLKLPVQVRSKSASWQDLEDAVVLVQDGAAVMIKDIAAVQMGGVARDGEGAIWSRIAPGSQDTDAVILTVLKSPKTDSIKIDRLLSELDAELPPDLIVQRHTFTAEDVSVTLHLPPGINREQQDQICRQVLSVLKEVPEIESVWRRTMREETTESLDRPARPVLFAALKRKAERERAAIQADIRKRIAKVPGITATLGKPVAQPMACAAVQAQIVVKVFGPDLEILRSTAREISRSMSTVAGVTDLLIEPEDTGPQLHVQIKKDRAALYGVTTADMNLVLETALQGRVIGEVVQKDRRLDLVVMYDEKMRPSPETIGKLQFVTAGNKVVPLDGMVDISYTEGPGVICRENMQRRMVVSGNVQGRDRIAVLAEIGQALQSVEGKLPRGYFIKYDERASLPEK